MAEAASRGACVLAIARIIAHAFREDRHDRAAPDSRRGSSFCQWGTQIDESCFHALRQAIGRVDADLAA
jgi:hypothetical protein